MNVQSVSTTSSAALKEDRTVPIEFPYNRVLISDAVRERDHERLKLLLDKAKIHIINKNQKFSMALKYAVEKNDEVSVELLLAHGAIPDYNKSKHGCSESTLSKAIKSGNQKIIEMLLNHGCDPDTILQINPHVWSTMHSNHWYEIVKKSDISILKLTLKCKGREIKDNDAWNQKLLITATAVGSRKAIEYLLDQGISVESSDEDSWTCLFYAAVFRRIHIVELFIARGANVKHKDLEGRSILHLLVRDCVQYNQGFEIDKRIIELLINHGADINATDVKGLTPINAHSTLKDAHFISIQDLLCCSNIDISKPDIDGITVLHRVVSKRLYRVIKDVLRKLEVDVNAQDKVGKTPMEYMNVADYKGCLSLLLEFGADTTVIHRFHKSVFRDKVFLKELKLYQLKRRAAELSNDVNIDTILNQHCTMSMTECAQIVSIYSKEIERIKSTMLFKEMSFFDFLHGKKRTCVIIAKRPMMQNIFLKCGHNFGHYANMLTKSYLYGARPFTQMETEAITFAENNLDVIFNNNLPSLVTNNIKKYIDIEDYVTIKKLLQTNN